MLRSFFLHDPSSSPKDEGWSRSCKGIKIGYRRVGTTFMS